MRQAVTSYSVQFTKISGVALLLVMGISLFLGWEIFRGAVPAYLLSFVFVGSNVVVLHKLKTDNHSRFYRVFFWSLAVRFSLIIVCLVLVLGVIKFHQILFTVSFIISYIFHSVIEIIFINKILETDS